MCICFLDLLSMPVTTSHAFIGFAQRKECRKRIFLVNLRYWVSMCIIYRLDANCVVLNVLRLWNYLGFQ